MLLVLEHGLAGVYRENLVARLDQISDKVETTPNAGAGSGDLSHLSDEELQQIAEIHKKALDRAKN